MSFDSLTLAIALASGSAALLLSRHLKAPGIVALLIAGIALGPDALNLVDPEKLGGTLRAIVGLAVAVILFEGGLQLNLSHMVRQASVIRNLITWGALITAVGGALAAHLLMDWPWTTSLLFGSLIIVTGPTVVTPLLRRIRLKRKLNTILEAEGVSIDPIGAIVAVVVLDFVITSAGNTSQASFITPIITVLLKVGIGICIGILAGLFIGWLLQHDEIIPDDMRNMLTLSFVLLIHEVSNFAQHESGIMTVTVAGIVVGNMKSMKQHELAEFNEQLTTFLIGMLFVLLAADVRVEKLLAFGQPSFWTICAILFLVRPANVFLCTMGSKISLKEKLFMAWLAPRGIVAAAVASLFAFDLAKAGLDGGEELRAMVFAVIAVTVVLQGFSAGPIASLLGLRQKQNDGYAFIGAGPIGLILAEVLQGAGESIVLMDHDDEDCIEAQRRGYQVIYGNALEERTLRRAELGSRRGVIALTSNEGVNIMALKKAHSVEKTPLKYICLTEGSKLDQVHIHDLQAHILFGQGIDYDLWTHRLRHGEALVESWQYPKSEPLSLDQQLDHLDHSRIGSSVLLLAVDRYGVVVPYTRTFIFQETDILILALDPARTEQVHGWLRIAGFTLFTSSTTSKL